jgi:hypothetical protein
VNSEWLLAKMKRGAYGDSGATQRDTEIYLALEGKK